MNKLYKISTILFLLLIATAVSAQESNNGKTLWAKSVLNESAPELTVEEWLSEKPKTEGKFILVDFWATWCGPCRKVIPELNEWHKELGDKLIIVGLSDEKADIIKGRTDIKIDYYSAIDTKKTLNKKLEVKGIPHCILIDPKGIVRWEGFPTLGGHELTKEVLTNLIKKYSIN